MPEIIITSREGESQSLAFDATDKPSLMEIIRNKSSFDLMAMCGGMMSCSTCHVYIDPEWTEKLEPITEEEKDLVSMSEYYRPASRLSCQINLDEDLDGLRATIAPED